MLRLCCTFVLTSIISSRVFAKKQNIRMFSSKRWGMCNPCAIYLSSAFCHAKSTRNQKKGLLHTNPLLLSGPLRLHSTSSSTPSEKKLLTSHLGIRDTPLGKNDDGAILLDGLDVYTVPASEDSHPITIYGIESKDKSINAEGKRRPILLLSGRTWSSIPVYHLLGGKNAALHGHESLSFMESLLQAGLQPYTMDFRGFGGTPPHATNKVEPNRCVMDVETALSWILDRHNLDPTKGCSSLPALLGWSQGALVAQLLAQKSPSLISKLILYGSIYDPLVTYPRKPLYSQAKGNEEDTVVYNNHDAAIEDFTMEGSIMQEHANLFAEAALIADPVKAQWTSLHQFNNCDPARVHVPTLVVAGDQDPYAPLRVQQELFSNLGRGSDRTWSIIADADHAAHLLGGRKRFTNIVVSFTSNGKKGQTV